MFAVSLSVWAVSGVLAQDRQSTVHLDGRALFRVSATDEASAGDQAARVESRLAALLEGPDDLPPAVAAPSDDGWLVTVAGVPVATVTPTDAEGNLSNCEVLARQ